MQPSSLLFLVIIVIWAAYLLQHWVRRREHLATARSVDRFSEAMRVLDRRTPLVGSDRPRSYAISPARPSRPEADVTRDRPLSPNALTRPAAAMRRPPVVRAFSRSVARVRGLSPRRVRGLSLLASLSLAVIALPLAAFSILPWWAVLVTVAVLVADLPLLRHAAITDRAARRARRHADRPKVRAARYSASTSPAVEDQEAGAAEGASPNASQAEADPTGWAPVPVPPPTYTLKAKAERPSVVPEAFTEPMGAGSSGPDGVVEESELVGLMDRRSAAGA